MKIKAFVAVFEDGSHAILGGHDTKTGEKATRAHMADLTSGLQHGDCAIHVVEADVPDYEAPAVIEGRVV